MESFCDVVVSSFDCESLISGAVIRVLVTGTASPRYSLRRHLPAGVVHLPMMDAARAPVSALLSAV